MKKALLLVSTCILFAVLGCSKNSQNAVSKAALPVFEAPAAPANVSPAAEPVAALPEVSVAQSDHPSWHSENIKDLLGNAVALKQTSLDGKFDLVILQRGTHSFLSFVRHAQWESVHSRPATGKLMYLRAKFEDGGEKRIEWDELGSGTTNLYGVVWSYPAKTGAPVGPVLERSLSDTVGGDELLIQDIIKHRAMLLEVEPGVTTQFDVTGLAREFENSRGSKTLEAKRTAG
jgi:hypothetical protein